MASSTIKGSAPRHVLVLSSPDQDGYVEVRYYTKIAAAARSIIVDKAGSLHGTFGTLRMLTDGSLAPVDLSEVCHGRPEAAWREAYHQNTKAEEQRATLAVHVESLRAALEERVAAASLARPHADD